MTTKELVKFLKLLNKKSSITRAELETIHGKDKVQELIMTSYVSVDHKCADGQGGYKHSPYDNISISNEGVDYINRYNDMHLSNIRSWIAVIISVSALFVSIGVLALQFFQYYYR